MQFPRARRFPTPPPSSVPGPGSYDPHSPVQQYKKGALGVFETERFTEPKIDPLGPSSSLNMQVKEDKENQLPRKRIASTNGGAVGDRERHRQQLEELKTRLTSIHEKELLKVQTKVTRLETTRDELVKEKQENGKQMMELKSEIRHLTSKLTKTESLLSKHQTSLPLLQRKLTSLQTSHEQSRTRKEVEMEGLKKQVEELSERLREKVEEVGKWEEGFLRERDARRRETNLMGTIVEEYERRLREVRLEELAEERFRRTKVERQRDDRSAQVESLVEYSQGLESKVSIVTRELAMIERQYQEVLELWRQDREMLVEVRDEKEWRQRARSDQRELVGLVEEIDSARKEAEVISSIEKDCENVWRLRKREWRVEKESLNRNFEVVEGELDLAVNEEIPRLETCLSTANSDLTSLRERLSEEQDLVKTLEDDVARLEREAIETCERFEGELEQQRLTLQGEEKDLEKERVDKRRVVGILVQSRAAETALREQVEQLTSQVQVLTPLMEEHSTLQETIDHLARMNAATEQDLQDLMDQNAELAGHSNQNQKIKHVAALREELIDSKRKNLTTLSLLSAAQSKVKTLTRELESYRAVVPNSSSSTNVVPTVSISQYGGLAGGGGGRSRVTRPDVGDALDPSYIRPSSTTTTTTVVPEIVTSQSPPSLDAEDVTELQHVSNQTTTTRTIPLPPSSVVSSLNRSNSGTTLQPRSARPPSHPLSRSINSNTTMTTKTIFEEEEGQLLPPLLAKSASSFLTKPPPPQQQQQTRGGKGGLVVRDARQGRRSSVVPSSTSSSLGSGSGSGAERMLGRMSVSELFN